METTANKLLFLSGYMEFPAEIKIFFLHSYKVCELVYKPKPELIIRPVGRSEMNNNKPDQSIDFFWINCRTINLGY